MDGGLLVRIVDKSGAVLAYWGLCLLVKTVDKKY
jgi:hypothetical protein